MLSKAEVDYLTNARLMKPGQQKYIRYCIRRKLKAFETRDLPALLANAWSAGLFKQVLQVMNCNNQVMDGNNLSKPVSENRVEKPGLCGARDLNPGFPAWKAGVITRLDQRRHPLNS